MSDIFSIVKGLEVSAEEIAKGELFTQQLLQDRFPSTDWRQGTGVRDLVVRPNGMMIALMDKAIRTYFQQNSLSQANDGSSEELVDSILSNFFINRNQGTLATIRTRLYFKFPGDRPQVVQVPATAYFSTDNEHKFYPDSAITLYPASSVVIPGRIYFQLDSASGLWYVDVDMKSEEPDEIYNMSEGDLLYYTIFSPYFVKGEIQYLIDQAIPKERNTSMIERSYTSISTRNLINTPSVVSRLTDVFNFIRFVHSEGMGDPNMYRDIVEINDPVTPGATLNFHQGGMVDVYVATKPRTILKQWVTDESGDIYMPGAVFYYARSAISGSVEGDPDLIPFDQPFTVTMVNQSEYSNGVPTTPALDIGLSADQVIKISFGEVFPLKTASFVTKEYPNILDVQSFLDAKEDRVVCAGYLTRGYEPHRLSIHVELHSETPVTKVAVEAAIRTYIDDLPNGGTLFISDIYGILDDLEVYGVKSPMVIDVIHTDKGLNNTSYQITDKKSLPITHKFVLDSFDMTVTG